jgi:hypothetical protein
VGVGGAPGGMWVAVASGRRGHDGRWSIGVVGHTPDRWTSAAAVGARGLGGGGVRGLGQWWCRRWQTTKRRRVGQVASDSSVGSGSVQLSGLGSGE